MHTPLHIPTIAAYHRLMELEKPEHPLVSVIRFEDIKRHPGSSPRSIIHSFYSIALKKDFQGKMKYGHQEFDFDEGVMHFMSPKQVLTIEPTNKEAFTHTGWLLLIHPDFLWNTALSTKIKKYEYFDYQVNEALHLAEKEEVLIIEIIKRIEQEYRSNIDSSSQDVIIAQIELLLTYCKRFYQRQFITRKISNHGVLSQLEDLLTRQITFENLSDNGLPTVPDIARQLNLSANYLSRLLQTLTGKSTRHYIQDRVIDLAKEMLSTTNLSVSEIAHGLGFEHPQSFSKLFKIRTSLSPLEFRQSYA